MALKWNYKTRFCGICVTIVKVFYIWDSGAKVL